MSPWEPPQPEPAPSDDADRLRKAPRENAHGDRPGSERAQHDDAAESLSAPPADPQLERLLSDARWPEPTPESIARLEAVWQSLTAQPSAGIAHQDHSPPEKIAGAASPAQAPLWRWSAAAAVIVAATGLAGWWLARPTESRLAKRPQVERHMPSERAAPKITPAVEIVVSRSPNAFETLVAVADRKQRGLETPPSAIRPAGNSSPAVPKETNRAGGRRTQRERVAAWLDAAITQLVQSPDALRELVEELPSVDRRLTEKLLTERIAKLAEPERDAAIVLLAPLASAQSLPLLREAYRQDEYQFVVLPALLRLETSARLRDLALAAAPGSMRQNIVAALWERTDPATKSMLFELAADPAIGDQVASALSNAERPPLDWLSAVVADAPRVSDRTRAAEILGRSNDDACIQRLIELTQGANSRQAAMAGLLASSNPAAKQFVASAEQDPYLVASLWNARRQQADVPNPVGDLQHGTP